MEQLIIAVRRRAVRPPPSLECVQARAVEPEDSTAVKIVSAILRNYFDDCARPVAILGGIRAYFDFDLFDRLRIRGDNCGATPALAIGANAVDLVPASLHARAVRTDLH